MTRTHMFALLGALVTTAASAAEPPKAPFFPYAMKSSTLKNGLRVVRVPYTSPGLVAYYTVVRTGSRNEVEPGLTGFAHFFEHMMFKGTEKYPAGSREKIVGKLGFNENAFTNDDTTVYHLFGPTSALEQVVDLESDRFARLKYSEEAFQTEAKAVLGEYHKSASSPELKIEEGLQGTAFTAHPYKHTTLGVYEDVKAMPTRYEYSKQFFKRWYTPDNCTVIVVGDFDDAMLMALIERAYAGWEGKTASVVIPPEPPQRGQRVVDLDWAGPTLPRLIYAWHTPASRADAMDGAIQTVLIQYLVGPTSQLNKDLVLDQQIAASVGSYFAPHRDPFLFSLAADVRDVKDRKRVSSAFDGAIKSLVTGRVDAKKVEAIKSHLRYQLLMGTETADDLAEVLAYYTGVYGTPESIEPVMQSLAAVQPKQLVEFAKRYFTAANRTILTLTSKPAATPGATK